MTAEHHDATSSAAGGIPAFGCCKVGGTVHPAPCPHHPVRAGRYVVDRHTYVWTIFDRFTDQWDVVMFSLDNGFACAAITREALGTMPHAWDHVLRVLQRHLTRAGSTPPRVLPGYARPEPPGIRLR